MMRLLAGGNRKVTIKLSVFAFVMTAIFIGLSIIFSQYRFGSSDDYHAVFSNASGLRSGQKVRIAGVPVGSVEGVKIIADNQVQVDFNIDTKFTIFSSTKAVVRYENLVGDRYLELLEGVGSLNKLSEGGFIPVTQTEPALDLDLLIGGFKPLLKGLSAEQVNDLSGALLQIFQGQGGSIAELFSNTGSFSKSISNRDDLVGQVISHLNEALRAISEKRNQFDATIEQLQQLMSGLAQDKDPIGAALPRIANATNDLSLLIKGIRPDLQGMISELNRTATQLDIGKEDINNALSRLPNDYQKMASVGSYGGMFQFYLCGTKLKFSGPDGKTLYIDTPGGQVGGRCGPVS
ncbi:MAG: MCE family protein [Mycobacteriaceae bacterium]